MNRLMLNRVSLAYRVSVSDLIQVCRERGFETVAQLTALLDAELAALAALDG